MGVRSVERHDFFFQAEDGIRDVAVTGVQTCALPICSLVVAAVMLGSVCVFLALLPGYPLGFADQFFRLAELDSLGFGEALRTFGDRSEERRVGKECRSRWSPYH